MHQLLLLRADKHCLPRTKEKANGSRAGRWIILSPAADCKSSGADMHDDTTARIEARLRKLGLVLPDPPRAAGAYLAVVVRNGVGAVSGQFPFSGGELQARGRIGAEVSEAVGRRAAQLAALNILAQIRAALDGFSQFGGLLRVDGWVACAPGFTSQPSILDGASECLWYALGEQLGAHTRTVSPVDRLPFDAPVELAATFATRSALSAQAPIASGAG
jgi:enamine deaminase RidA (YjgF/YER057c/UK114 family)